MSPGSFDRRLARVEAAVAPDQLVIAFLTVDSDADVDAEKRAYEAALNLHPRQKLLLFVTIYEKRPSEHLQ